MRRPTQRLLALGVVALMLLGPFLGAPAAAAQPPTSVDALTPGTAAWTDSVWMRSPQCATRGGDFSLWTRAVLEAMPTLLAHFDPAGFGVQVPEADRPRSDATLVGYRQLAAALGTKVPSGYCVDDMRRWAGADPSAAPFGFSWGQDGQSLYSCVAAAGTTSIGADRAPCDGFAISCAAVPEPEQQRCRAWNTFSDSVVRRVDQLRGDAIRAYPSAGQGSTRTRLATPEDLVDSMAENWFRDVTTMISTGATAMLAEAMTWWVRTDRADMPRSPAITEIHDLLRFVGVGLLVGGMLWQGLRMVLIRKPDPLVSTVTGLLTFTGWSSLGATVAVLINEAGLALTNQVLDDGITDFSTSMSEAMRAAMQTNAATVLLLGIILFLLACVQWMLGFFRMGAVVILLALIPTAAAGQLTEATKPWLRKVAGSCLALLLYQPIAGIIYRIGFTLMSETDDLTTVLVGLAVLTLAAMSMPTMLRFFDWGGQRLTTGGSRGGGAMAIGAVTTLAGAGGPSGMARFMDQSGPAGAGPGPTPGAVSVTPAVAGHGPAEAASSFQSLGSGAPAAAGARSGASAVVAPAAGSASVSTAGAASGAAGGVAGGPVGVAAMAGVQVAAGAGRQAGKAMAEGAPGADGGGSGAVL